MSGKPSPSSPSAFLGQAFWIQDEACEATSVLGKTDLKPLFQELPHLLDLYKAGKDVQEHDDDNLVSEDIKAAFRLDHKLVASLFVRAVAGSIGTVVGDLPPNHQEVIAGQIVEACENLFFHF